MSHYYQGELDAVAKAMADRSPEFGYCNCGRHASDQCDLCVSLAAGVEEPDLNRDITARMAVRDLMSATTSLADLSYCKTTEWLVRHEANDIELAYKTLGRMLSRIRQEQSRAA